MRPLIGIILLSCCVFAANIQKKAEIIHRVDPFIGTGGHGHTYPGATLPFGMVQLSPDTRTDNWDACSGYHYSDKTILGFSHTHLSGTGVGDYGDVRFMPIAGNLVMEPGDEKSPQTGYRSHFSHNSEKASPGYYQVFLKDYGIKVELTTTLRVGFHRYVFPDQSNNYVIVDLKNGITSDPILASSIEIVGDRKIRGLRRTKGWGRDQYVYFVAEFSQPFSSSGIKEGTNINTGLRRSTGSDLKAYFRFSLSGNKELLVKVGISAVDMAGAQKNLQAEIPHWDFQKVKREAESKWESQLNKINISSRSHEQQRIFYTALYHSMLNPNVFMDVDGRYRGIDHRVHQSHDFTNYTVFSLWDTFRATHPLFTIIERNRTNDFIQTLLAKYDEGGILPIWELAGNYTGCMIGYHAVPMIVDAYVNGIRGYDTKKAYAAIRHSAMQDHLGLKSYKKFGYIPADRESESVSKTLEYAYDDWCIARMAQIMGKEDDKLYFINRAQFYKNLFNSKSGFMRPRRNGNWVIPFDPREVNFNFTEANSWQYSFFVPHDVTGLMGLFGGKRNFIEKLDKMFSEPAQTTGRNQADITGLIGQYAHGNEPSHHMAYLYNYAGAPWKTQERVREICRKLYTDLPDGLCGNEDCGQMSAWYVLSTLGFYPVCPGSGNYLLTSPQFAQAVIQLESGKRFVVVAANTSDKNMYIQAAWLNGHPYERAYISHEDIVAGGKLVFKMGRKPNKQWGSITGLKDGSLLHNHPLVATPMIISQGKTFKEYCQVVLRSPMAGSSIFYTLDGKNPSIKSQVYSKPFRLDKTTMVKAFAYKPGIGQSHPETATFVKISSQRKIKFITEPSPQYPGEGKDTLIDTLRGPGNFRVGSWLGFHGKNMEVVIDLGKTEKIERLALGCLQETGAWIFFPTQVEFFTSRDGKHYDSLGGIDLGVERDKTNTSIHDFSLSFNERRIRFIKVLAKNVGVCPVWHVGRGEKAWIFVDEIVIE